MIGSSTRLNLTTAGELMASTTPSSPPGSTDVNESAKSTISAPANLDFVIPNGKTLTIQRFFGGSNFPDKTAIVILQEEVSTGVFTDRSTLYMTGNSNQADINLDFVGDGALRMRIVRDPQGNTVEVFGQFIGFLQDTP